eukprot:549298-Amphidinium_carterae.1
MDKLVNSCKCKCEATWAVPEEKDEVACSIHWLWRVSCHSSAQNWQQLAQITGRGKAWQDGVAGWCSDSQSRAAFCRDACELVVVEGEAPGCSHFVELVHLTVFTVDARGGCAG